jgi:hypothetical protein
VKTANRERVMNVVGRVARRALLCGLGLTMPAGASAQTPNVTYGIRVGYSDTEVRGIFRQVEALVRRDLHPVWTEGSSTSLRFGVEVLGGALGNRVDTSVVMGAGPHLAVGILSDRIVFDTGPTVVMMTNFTFGPGVSLGSPAQFITHWRLRFRLFFGIGLAYRYQHMSNGGLGLENPGLNLHMAEITFGL